MTTTKGFYRWIEDYLNDKCEFSPRTRRAYQIALTAHADDVDNRPPNATNRDDVKKTLRRWTGNTRRTRHAIYRAFYDWCMEEGIRKDNPARQVTPTKGKPVHVYRMTKTEAVAMMGAAKGHRERRAIYLGMLAGLRLGELRGLQGKHFEREDGKFIWVSADIAKGGRERWVPVLSELVPVVDEIRANVGLDEYVLCAERWRNPPQNTEVTTLKHRPASQQAVYRLVLRVGERAGIAARIHPHLLRHAFADHIARYAGVRNAQLLLGHADLGTTETYLGRTPVDEIAESISGFQFGVEDLLVGTPEDTPLETPLISSVKAPTGIEPVISASHLNTRDFNPQQADPRVLLALVAVLLQGQGVEP